MKVTVFGGSGFLGSHIADKFSEDGHDVKIVDKRESEWLREDQEMIIGNITDEKIVDKAVNGADVVLNFAGIADIGEANLRPVDTVKTNVLGNVIILEACKNHNVKRYIFASSLYVYGKSGGFYRCSKQACELYIENYQNNYGLTYTILRFGSLYGPRSGQKNSIAKFIHEAMETGEIKYYGSPDYLREYIHVEDAATATLSMIEPQYANKNIIISGHQSLRMGDLFTMLSEILDKPISIIYEDDPNSGHYHVTPYTFNPNIGLKYVPPLMMDMGQGLIQLIKEEFEKKSHKTDKQ